MSNLAKFIYCTGYPAKVGSTHAMHLGDPGFRVRSFPLTNSKNSSYFGSKIVSVSIQTSTRGSLHIRSPRPILSQYPSDPGHINLDFTTVGPEDVPELTGDAPMPPMVFIESSYNSKGSIGKSMIKDAQERGLITPGKTVLVEYTSGNSELALVPMAKLMGYSLIVVTREPEIEEKKERVHANGAQLRFIKGTPLGYTPPQAMLVEAKKICAESPNNFLVDQFDSLLNQTFHYENTGAEIWNETKGNVDILVSTIGTGGTLTGAGEFLKVKKNTIEVFGVDYGYGEYKHLPTTTRSLLGLKKMTKEGQHLCPLPYANSVLDGIVEVDFVEANKMIQFLEDKYDMKVGFSCGRAVAAAVMLSQYPENYGKLIVCKLSFPMEEKENDKYLLICKGCHGRERQN